MSNGTHPCRVAVVASGNGSNFQAILDSSEQLGYQVVQLIANRPGAYALERARLAGVPAQLIDHQGFSDREAFDRALASAIDQVEADVIALAGFMRILSDQFVQRFQGRLLNIHPSLLPRYPGMHTHQRAIDAGDTEHGASVHFVTAELDGGPVVAQGRVAISANDNVASLQAKVARIEHQLYPQVLGWIAAGRLALLDGAPLLDGSPISVA